MKIPVDDGKKIARGFRDDGASWQVGDGAAIFSRTDTEVAEIGSRGDAEARRRKENGGFAALNLSFSAISAPLRESSSPLSPSLRASA
jgi:hypothetical protein